jgi:hypothetical protein
LDITALAVTLRKKQPLSRASALASMVLPVPGVTMEQHGKEGGRREAGALHGGDFP